MNAGVKQEVGPLSTQRVVEEKDVVVGPHDDFYGTMSLARSVDEVFLPEHDFPKMLIISIVQAAPAYRRRISGHPRLYTTHPNFRSGDSAL